MYQTIISDLVISKSSKETREKHDFTIGEIIRWTKRGKPEKELEEEGRLEIQQLKGLTRCLIQWFIPLFGGVEDFENQIKCANFLLSRITHMCICVTLYLQQILLTFFSSPILIL
jgi:hypothetical protein